MLTNPFETQLVQSLGRAVGPRCIEHRGVRCGGSTARSLAMMPTTESHHPTRPGDPSRSVTSGANAAREHSRVRPPDGADRHREIRREKRDLEVDENPRRGHDFFGM